MTSLDREERNKSKITTLYEAFDNFNNVDQSVHLLFAPYLEWWFHGPPSHQHYLKRLLTGSSPNHLSFRFVPLSVAAFESTVIVEGFDEERSVAWVHAWALADGIITHVREYYNTSVTVTRLGNSESLSSSESTVQSANKKCQSVWQSKLCDESAVPGLVLAL